MKKNKPILYILLFLLIIGPILIIIYDLMNKLPFLNQSSPPPAMPSSRDPAPSIMPPSRESPHRHHGHNNGYVNIYSDFPVNQTKLLPHNGLFIRRNNEFGTKSNLGIKELIEQGKLIDQSSIHFDDFVSLNSNKIPLPQAGKSLAVSYGIAKIPANQKRDKRATHYLEIALRASDSAPTKQLQNQAPPINYVFVVDTSGSMDGEKLDSVKTSLREIFKKLRNDDAIGIIGFNDRPITLLKATPVGKLSHNDFSKIISNLSADRGTDINSGLSYGFAEISRYVSNQSLNHVYLFSDGNPTSGETDWIKIRQNIEKETRKDTHLSTFGFGSDADMRELNALAGVARGKSTFVTHPDDIKISLQDDLSRREYLAAVNMQIKVDINRNISIFHLYGHDQITDRATRMAVEQDIEKAKNKAKSEFGVKSQPNIVTEEKGIRIFVPDLAVGETYWVVFEVGIPKEKNQNPVGAATVQYVDTFGRKNEKHQFQLASPGNLPTDLVVQHSLGLRTSEVIFYALDDLYEKDIETAKKRLDNHASMLKSTNIDLKSEILTDDVITLNKFASLAQNLGKSISVTDAAPAGQETILVHGLNEFGRSRNGFIRTPSRDGK